MKDHFPEKWQEILSHNDLDSFEKLWALQLEWFEEPNQRRGGWSGVSRCDLNYQTSGEPHYPNPVAPFRHVDIHPRDRKYSAF
jgi:hypothetical protein